MRDRPSSRVRQSQLAADIPFQQKDCNTGPMSSRDSSPMLQVRLLCDVISDDDNSLHTLAVLCRLLPYQPTCPKRKSLEPRCLLEAPCRTLISLFAQRHCRPLRPPISLGPAQASACSLDTCAGNCKQILNVASVWLQGLRLHAQAMSEVSGPTRRLHLALLRLVDCVMLLQEGLCFVLQNEACRPICPDELRAAKNVCAIWICPSPDLRCLLTQ